MRSWSSRQISFCRCIYCCQRKKLLHIFILSNEILLPVPADLSIRIPPAMSTAACQLLCTANIVFCRSFAHLIYQPRAASSHAFSSLSAHWLLCRQMREQLGSCFGVCLCKAEPCIPPGQALPSLTCRDQQHMRTRSLAPPQCQQVLAWSSPPCTLPQTPQLQRSASRLDELPSIARVPPEFCLLCHQPASLSRPSDHHRHASLQVTAAHQDEQPSAARLPASSC